MSERDQTENDLSEQEIDDIVVAHADDDSVWDEPIPVRRTMPTSLSIPGDLAARAAFLAQLHRTKSVEDWLAHVIQERVELEEAAYIEVKESLATKVG